MRHIVSRHAFERVQDRLHMDPDELVRILDEDRVVLLGQREDKSFKLFFSEIDNSYFIAVAGTSNYILVTVLPSYFRLPWVISAEALQIAREVVLSEANQTASVSKQHIFNELSSSEVIRIMALIDSAWGSSRRINSLLKLQISEVGSDLDLISEDEKILSKVGERLKGHLRSGEHPSQVLMIIGKAKNIKKSKLFDMNLLRRYLW